MRYFILFCVFCVSDLALGSWTSDSEIGFVSQAGNTEQDNAFIKSALSKELGANEIKTNVEYINSSGKNQTTDTSSTLAESSLLKLQYIYGEKTALKPFASGLWERNRFAGFDNRYSGDVGLKYQFIKTETLKFSNETGYRYRAQYEYTVGPATGEKTESQFGRVYFGLEKKLNKTSNFKFFIEALYDFIEPDNIEMIFEPSIDVFLGEFFPNEVKPAQISLKVSYRGIYDNVPAQVGLAKYDSILSTGVKVIY